MEVILLLVFLAILILFAVFMLRGAIFLPTPERLIRPAMRLLDIRPGMRAVDVGSGDGRIIIGLAKAGVIAWGYEVNPILVIWSSFAIKRAGVSGLANVCWKSFWSASFSGVDIVFVFGIGHIMASLERKLRQELSPGAQVISYIFPLPGWKHEAHESGFYLYRQEKPASSV